MNGFHEIFTMFRGGSWGRHPPLDDHQNPALARSSVAGITTLIRYRPSASVPHCDLQCDLHWQVMPLNNLEDASWEHKHKSPFYTLKSVLFYSALKYTVPSKDITNIHFKTVLNQARLTQSRPKIHPSYCRNWQTQAQKCQWSKHVRYSVKAVVITIDKHHSPSDVRQPTISLAHTYIENVVFHNIDSNHWKLYTNFVI